MPAPIAGMAFRELMRRALPKLLRQRRSGAKKSKKRRQRYEMDGADGALMTIAVLRGLQFLAESAGRKAPPPPPPPRSGGGIIVDPETGALQDARRFREFGRRDRRR